MKNNVLLYLGLFNIVLAALAGDQSNSIVFEQALPTFFPLDETLSPHGTFLPESSYYFTQNASQENPIIIYPCSPCIGIQVCNVDNDECLYVHQHKMNSPQALHDIICKHFSPLSEGTQLNLDITLFTRTNEHHYKNDNFAEGSHKKRVHSLCNKISEGNVIKNRHIYYNQTSDDASNNIDYLKDRCIIFKNKKIYRLNMFLQKVSSDFNINKDYKIELYESQYLKKQHNLRVYDFHPFSIWRYFNIPLFHVKKPNMTDINALPSSSTSPIARFFPLTTLETFCRSNWYYLITGYMILLHFSRHEEFRVR